MNSADLICPGASNGRRQHLEQGALCAGQYGIAHEFTNGKPVTVRFEVLNQFDTIYQIRSGAGIGVFAPQYGPRRGYHSSVLKKL